MKFVNDTSADMDVMLSIKIGIAVVGVMVMGYVIYIFSSQLRAVSPGASFNGSLGNITTIWNNFIPMFGVVIIVVLIAAGILGLMAYRRRREEDDVPRYYR